MKTNPVQSTTFVPGRKLPGRHTLVASLLLAGVLAGCGGSDSSSDDTAAANSPVATEPAPTESAAPTPTSTEPATTVADDGTESVGEFNITFEGEEHSFDVFSCETTPEGDLLVTAESAAGARSGDASITVLAHFLVAGTYDLDRVALGSDAADPDGGIFVIIYFEGASSYDEISLDGWQVTINDDLSSGSFVALGPDVASGDFSCA